MADLGRDSPFPGTRLPALGDAGEVQQFLAAIVESSDDAILSKDLQGIITSWNGGCVRLFGYTADEAIGRPAAMLHPADRHDEEAMILTRLRLGEKIDHYETVRQRKDGSLVDISLSVSPIRNQHGTIVGASKVARDITAQKRAIEQQELLLGEMRHRVKNLSTVIEALARQSRPRDEPAVDSFVDAFMGRIRALLSTGELLLATPQRNVGLKQLLDRVLLPFVEPEADDRIMLDGLPIIIPERTAGNLALAMHELATNALKYGALKSPQGKVQIAWSSEPGDGGRRVQIDWRERGGEPILSEPERTGFGSRVITTALAGERDGASELHFEPGGLHCHFHFTLTDSD